MHRRRFIEISGAAALATAVGLPHLGTRAQGGYSAVDLGAPEGFDNVIPIALNNNGVAVVSASSADASGIFICENGTFTAVGEPDEEAFAAGINDSNQVAGWVTGASDGSVDAPDVPVLLTTDGQVAMPGEQIDGRVFAVASDGRAVGEAMVDKSVAAPRAVVWDNQEVAELKGTPDDGSSAAQDLNALGQIVGWIGAEDGSQRRAVLFSLEEDPVELGTLGGSQSEAVAVSEQGMVVGNSTTSDEQTGLSGNGVNAFSWVDGALTALQTLDNQAWSMAADVNSYGLVAGSVGLSAPATASAATTAIVWAPDAVLDLNQILQPVEGLTLTSAVAINELGQVLCAGIDASGASHAVLLSVLGN